MMAALCDAVFKMEWFQLPSTHGCCEIYTRQLLKYIERYRSYLVDQDNS